MHTHYCKSLSFICFTSDLKYSGLWLLLATESESYSKYRALRSNDKSIGMASG